MSYVICVAGVGCVTLRMIAETIQTSTRMCVRARTAHVLSLRCAATMASVSRRTGAATTMMTVETAAMNSTVVTSSARSVDNQLTIVDYLDQTGLKVFLFHCFEVFALICVTLLIFHVL